MVGSKLVVMLMNSQHIAIHTGGKRTRVQRLKKNITIEKGHPQPEYTLEIRSP